MPELPEIETVKLQLSKYLIGQSISAIEKLHGKSLFGKPELVIGKKVTAIKRLGKMLVIELSDDLVLAIHFKMSGQLILVRSDKQQVTSRVVGGHPSEDWVRKLPSTHTRVVFHFDSGDTMYFNDQRIFGWVKILTDKELNNLSFVKKLGPEIWNITAKELLARVKGRKKPIKVLIMDQGFLSGVGNIYANDALWEARIAPTAVAQSLGYLDVERLRDALIKVLKEGIKYGGATAADAKYINLHGMGGTYQEHFRTYDRDGKPCLRCKTIIKKITLGGRGTYYCDQCQK